MTESIQPSAPIPAELLSDLHQPDLTSAVLLAGLLLPGRVPASQLAPGCAGQAGLETGEGEEYIIEVQNRST